MLTEKREGCGSAGGGQDLVPLAFEQILHGQTDFFLVINH